jgi:ribosomal protein L7Ae-like RNA K-turn-binding protein
MEARAVAYIHMARKAGRVVAGNTQLLRALAQDAVTFVLLAEDAAPERIREYTAWCVRRQIPSRLFLTKTRLGALVDRRESSAIGILEIRLSERLEWYLEGMSRLTDR